MGERFTLEEAYDTERKPQRFSLEEAYGEKPVPQRFSLEEAYGDAPSPVTSSAILDQPFRSTLDDPPFAGVHGLGPIDKSLTGRRNTPSQDQPFYRPEQPTSLPDWFKDKTPQVEGPPAEKVSDDVRLRQLESAKAMARQEYLSDPLHRKTATGKSVEQIEKDIERFTIDKGALPDKHGIPRYGPQTLAALNELAEAEAIKHSQLPAAGVGESLLREVDEKKGQGKLTFAGAVLNTLDLAEVLAASKRFENWTATAEDTETVRRYLYEEAKNRRPKTTGGGATGIVANLPTFAIEIGATGGIFKGAAVGTTKFLRSQIDNILSGAIRRAARVGAAGAGRVVGAAAQAGAPAMLGRASESAVRRALPKEIGGDDAGLIEAVAKGYGDSFVEVFSERGVPGLSPLLSKIPIPKRVQALKDVVASRWLKGSVGRTAKQFDELVKKGGYNGVVGELLEEELGKAMRAGMSIDEYRATTGKEFLEQLIAFAAIPGAKTATALAANADQAIDRAIMGAQAKDVLDAIERGDRGAALGLMAKGRKNGNISDQEFARLMAVMPPAAKGSLPDISEREAAIPKPGEPASPPGSAEPSAQRTINQIPRDRPAPIGPVAAKGPPTPDADIPGFGEPPSLVEPPTRPGAVPVSQPLDAPPLAEEDMELAAEPEVYDVTTDTQRPAVRTEVSDVRRAQGAGSIPTEQEAAKVNADRLRSQKIELIRLGYTAAQVRAMTAQQVQAALIRHGITPSEVEIEPERKADLAEPAPPPVEPLDEGIELADQPEVYDVTTDVRRPALRTEVADVHDINRPGGPIPTGQPGEAQTLPRGRKARMEAGQDVSAEPTAEELAGTIPLAGRRPHPGPLPQQAETPITKEQIGAVRPDRVTPDGAMVFFSEDKAKRWKETRLANLPPGVLQIDITPIAPFGQPTGNFIVRETKLRPGYQEPPSKPPPPSGPGEAGPPATLRPRPRGPAPVAPQPVAPASTPTAQAPAPKEPISPVPAPVAPAVPPQGAGEEAAKQPWEMTAQEETDAGLPLYERFRAAQKAMEDGELVVGTPQYDYIKGEANKSGHGLIPPAWQTNRDQISSDGFSTDINRVLSWMGLKKAQRENLLSKYATDRGSRDVPVGREGARTSKPTYRYSRADTNAILDEAHRMVVDQALSDALPVPAAVLAEYGLTAKLKPQPPAEPDAGRVAERPQATGEGQVAAPEGLTKTATRQEPALSNADLLSERQRVLDEAWQEAQDTGFDDFDVRGRRRDIGRAIADIDRDLAGRGFPVQDLPTLDRSLEARQMRRDSRLSAEQRRGTTVDLSDESAPPDASAPGVQGEAEQPAPAADKPAQPPKAKTTLEPQAQQKPTKRPYTTIPRDWIGKPLVAWSGAAVSIAKGHGAATGAKNRKTRNMPGHMASQLTKVPLGSVRLINWIKQRTDEVWRVGGAAGGHHLAPTRLVEEGKQAIPDWGQDADDYVAAKKRRKESDVARQKRGYLVWGRMPPAERKYLIQLANREGITVKEYLDRHNGSIDAERAEADVAAKQHTDDVARATSMTPQQWKELMESNDAEAERLANLVQDIQETADEHDAVEEDTAFAPRQDDGAGKEAGASGVDRTTGEQADTDAEAEAGPKGITDGTQLSLAGEVEGRATSGQTGRMFDESKEPPKRKPSAQPTTTLPPDAARFGVTKMDMRAASAFADDPSAAYAYGVKLYLAGSKPSKMVDMSAAEVADAKRGFKEAKAGASPNQVADIEFLDQQEKKLAEDTETGKMFEGEPEDASSLTDDSPAAGGNDMNFGPLDIFDSPYYPRWRSERGESKAAYGARLRAEAKSLGITVTKHMTDHFVASEIALARQKTGALDVDVLRPNLPIRGEDTETGKMFEGESETEKEAERTHHIALYNGKAVLMDYLSDSSPKSQFKMAGQRIADNNAEGYIITPSGEVFKVTKSSRMAKPVVGTERDSAIQEASRLIEESKAKPQTGEGQAAGEPLTIEPPAPGAEPDIFDAPEYMHPFKGESPIDYTKRLSKEANRLKVKRTSKMTQDMLAEDVARARIAEKGGAVKPAAPGPKKKKRRPRSREGGHILITPRTLGLKPADVRGESLDRPLSTKDATGGLLEDETGAIDLNGIKSFVGGRVKGAADFIDGIARYFSQGMADNLRGLGGQFTRQFAFLVDATIDRAKAIRGSMAKEIDAALKLTRRPWSGTTWAMTVEKRHALPSGGTYGVRNFAEALEGHIKVPAGPYQRMINALMAFNLKSGETYRDSGGTIVDRKTGERIRFRPRPNVFVRIFNIEARDAILNGEGKLFDAIVEATADMKENGMTLDQAREAWLKVSEELGTPKGGNTFSPNRQINLETMRVFKRMPTDIWKNGFHYEILEGNPFQYVNRVADMVARRSAIVEFFGDTNDRLIEMRDAVGQEIRGGNIGHFDDLVAVMNGAPLGRPVSGHGGRILGPGTVGYRAAHAVNDGLFVLKGLYKSLAAIANLSETAFGNVPIFLGYKNMLKAVTKVMSIRDALELEGTLTRDFLNLSFDPNSPFRSLARGVGRSLDVVTLNRAVNEFQEYLSAATARVVSERAKKKRLSLKERASIKNTLLTMGFDKETAEGMVAGKGRPDEYEAFERKAASFLVGANKYGPENSRFGNDRYLRSLFAFTTYPITKLNSGRRIWDEYARARREGDKAGQNQAIIKAGRWMFGTTLQGAAQAMLLAMVNGSLDDELYDLGHNPTKTVLEYIVYAGLSGPWMAVYRWGMDPERSFYRSMADSVFPIAAMGELQDMWTGRGKYRNQTELEKAHTFLTKRIPVGRLATSLLAVVGIASKNPDLEAGMRRYWSSDVRKPSEEDEWSRIQAERIAKMADADTTNPKIGKMLVEWLGGPEMSPAKVASSLRSKRVLSRHSPEEISKLQSEMPRSQWEALVHRDAVLDLLADSMTIDGRTKWVGSQPTFTKEQVEQHEKEYRENIDAGGDPLVMADDDSEHMSELEVQLKARKINATDRRELIRLRRKSARLAAIRKGLREKKITRERAVDLASQIK